MVTESVLQNDGDSCILLEKSGESSALFFPESHALLRVEPALGRRLKGDAAEVHPANRELWNRLLPFSRGVRHNSRLLGESALDDGAHLALNLNLTHSCNLACTYCFAEGGDYGYLSSDMGIDMVEPLFHFIEKSVTANRKVRFEFFGGEPLLNFHVIREVCRRSRDFSKRHGVDFIYRISTNLATLTEEALELLAEYRFIVSVSIDGGRETHDRNRPMKGGQGSFDRIIENCKRIRSRSPHSILVARMTVADHRESLRDNFESLHSLSIFDYFQILPAFVVGEKAEERDKMERVLERFQELLDNYPRYFAPENRFRGILEWERIADIVLGRKVALSHCSGGRLYYTFSADGSVSPCHRLVGADGFRFYGAENRASLHAPEWTRSVESSPECSSCWVRYICAGGCKQENLHSTGDLNRPHSLHCEFEKRIAAGVIHGLAAREDCRLRERSGLEDLFVSCGRPVVSPSEKGGEASASDGEFFFPVN